MPIFAFFIIVVIALLVVRIGATALMMTGLSRDVAEFQAISCFFGVGFTTTEAEMIVGHPTRRRIASHLIIAGNIGLTSALSTVIITFVDNDQNWLDDMIPLEGSGKIFFKFGMMLLAILIIGGIFRLQLVKKILEAGIKASLAKFHKVRAMDYETVLRSSDGYAVIQVDIEPDHSLVGRTLAGIELSEQGVLVLGIRRSNGQYIGAPHSTTQILEEDLLTVYGKEEDVFKALDFYPNKA
ncbi:MAG: TrkA C-terminal domain-containing protein [Phycisphaerales bacterium]|nr:TrkA C-terminal domain-containing protein [Phycisphaerales bacterium]